MSARRAQRIIIEMHYKTAVYKIQRQYRILNYLQKSTNIVSARKYRAW